MDPAEPVAVRLRTALAALLPAGLKAPLKRALGLPLTSLHSQWSILTPIGPVFHDHVLLDIGAHHGWFFHCWKNWSPGARIYAFEPYPPAFDKASALYGADADTHIYPEAVGAETGKRRLNVLEQSPVSNSLLEPDESAWRDVAFRHGDISTVDVNVTTIDDIVGREKLGGVYLLKIDTQGFEMEVLRGAADSLPRVDHIFVESGIRGLYRDAPRFSDVFEFLTDRGFHLMAMQSWHRGNHVLVETDMLFRRNDLAPKVDPEAPRIYQQSG